MHQVVDKQLWMENSLRLVTHGLLKGFAVVPVASLFAVVGIYQNGAFTSPLAKYASEAKATSVCTWLTAMSRSTQENS